MSCEAKKMTLLLARTERWYSCAKVSRWLSRTCISRARSEPQALLTSQPPVARWAAIMEKKLRVLRCGTAPSA